MITDADVVKLKETFVSKDHFDKTLDVVFAKLASKEDLTDLEERLSKVEGNTANILAILDGLAKKFDDLKHEYVAVSLKGDRHERWIKKIAKKTKTKLA